MEPDAAAWTSSPEIGSFYLALLTDRSWVRRRVESIEILDLERINRRVTLDIDVAHLRQLSDDSGGAGTMGDEIFVPIATWPKGLQLDIDLATADGHVTPLITSTEDSILSQQTVLAALASETSAEYIADLPEFIKDDILAVTRDDDGERLSEVLALRNAAAIRDSIDLTDGDGERAKAWLDITTDPDILPILTQFADKYLVVVPIPTKPDVVVFKYRYVDSWPTPRATVRSRLGLLPFDIALSAPSVSSAQREHTRVIAPAGTTIERATMDEFTPERLYLEAGLPKIPGTVLSRISTERAVFYTRGVPEGQWWLLLALRPRLGTFYIPSMASVGLTLLVLLVLIWRLLFASTPKSDNVEAIVTVVLVAPSIFSVYLSRASEHEALSRIMFWPRMLVFGTAVLTIGVAVLLALSQPYIVPLYVAAGFSLVVWVILVFTTFVTWRRRNHVREDSDLTLAVEISGASGT